MFANNRAGYGPNIAGVPSALEILETNSPRLLEATSSADPRDEHFKTLPNIKLGAKDPYGQLVSTDNETPLKLRLSSQHGVSLINNQDYYLPVNGIYEIKNL